MVRKITILVMRKPSGSYRVLRGGGWISLPAFARVANRNRPAPDYRRGMVLGFRLIVEVPCLGR